jgi:copper chaperone CopZ
VPKVREALESVDGVESVQVDFESAQAVIKMQPGKDLTVEACDKSFGNQGYFVSAIEERAPATADAGS